MRISHRVLSVLAVGGLLAGLGGCYEPYGYSKGRVDVGTSTKGEERSNQALPTALVEFSDRVAMELPQKLVEIPEIRTANAAGKRITVYVGDINNKTGVTSSNDFEMVRNRIRNSVLQSTYVREKVLFKENRARLDALRAREGLPPAGPMGAGPDYDPRSTYWLTGDFYRVNRDHSSGDSNLYYMEFMLLHDATGEIIPFAKYEVKQWRP